MALPKLVTPEYTLTLPSNKQKVKYRPYLVKEEKVLLTAMETAIDKEKSVQNETIRNSTITVINECTFNKVDLNALPEFDIEYLSQSSGHVNRGFKYKITHWDNLQALRDKIKKYLSDQLEQL